MIKAAFLDIDGTVYSHFSASVPDSAFAAFSAARKKGVKLFGCTGRHMAELKSMNLDTLPFDGWVLVNGARCIAAGKVIRQKPISGHDLQVLMRELQKDPFPVIFLSEEDMFLNMASEKVLKDLDSIHTPLPPIRQMDADADILVQVIPYIDDERWHHIEQQMKEVRSLFSLVNPFSARETVATETPQTSAISFNLTNRNTSDFQKMQKKKSFTYKYYRKRFRMSTAFAAQRVSDPVFS